MQIDPLEAIIKWLTAEFTPAQGRVAGKHRYGVTWPVDLVGLVVRIDDASDELYGQTSKNRLEISIYGPNRAAIRAAWQALVDLCKTRRRFTVVTSQGTALVHYVNPSSGFSFLRDKDVKLEMGVVFYEALVAEESVA